MSPDNVLNIYTTFKDYGRGFSVLPPESTLSYYFKSIISEERGDIYSLRVIDNRPTEFYVCYSELPIFIKKITITITSKVAPKLIAINHEGKEDVINMTSSIRHQGNLQITYDCNEHYSRVYFKSSTLAQVPINFSCLAISHSDLIKITSKLNNSIPELKESFDDFKNGLREEINETEELLKSRKDELAETRQNITHESNELSAITQAVGELDKNLKHLRKERASINEQSRDFRKEMAEAQKNLDQTNGEIDCNSEAIVNLNSE
ncbi:hypothetical protein, partial [Photobacterium sanguinicancri]